MQTDLATHTTLAEMRQLLEALAPSRTLEYGHLGSTLRRFSHWNMRKTVDRGLVRSYVQCTTGLSHTQVARLIASSDHMASLGHTRRSLRDKDW